MKSIFDKTTREELISRINILNESSSGIWGKMNIYQMINHCILWDEMVLNNKIYQRVFIGRFLGKMALKSILKDRKILNRNTPTIPEFIIKETNIDLTNDKIKWIALLERYEHFVVDTFRHPFFGEMNREQIGLFVYKHSDHHLRQFNS